MRCYIYDYWGKEHLATAEVEPECGEDFCDTCGDCLKCYGGDICSSELGHYWVFYAPREGP